MFIVIVLNFIKLGYFLCNVDNCIDLYLQCWNCDTMSWCTLWMYWLGLWSQKKFRLLFFRTILVINRLFRNCEVVIGISQFVIASTTSYWYFSHLRNEKLSSPVCKSFCRALTYHLGSIAFGALILCILFILQLIF